LGERIPVRRDDDVERPASQDREPARPQLVQRRLVRPDARVVRIGVRIDQQPDRVAAEERVGGVRPRRVEAPPQTVSLDERRDAACAGIRREAGRAQGGRPEHEAEDGEEDEPRRHRQPPRFERGDESSAGEERRGARAFEGVGERGAERGHQPGGLADVLRREDDEGAREQPARRIAPPRG